MKAAIDQIAKKCGVSKSTVSRVLNRRPHVKEDVQRRVLEAIQEMHYEPRQLATKKTVAIVGAGFGTRIGLYEASVVSGLISHLAKLGVATSLQPAEGFSLERAFEVRCVICLPGTKLELSKGVEGIVVNGAEKGFHAVRSDHAQGVALAVEKLAEKGHRRIGLLVGGSGGWGDLERERGWREAVARLGLDRDEELLRRRDAPMTECMAKLLLAKPTAIVATGEDAALEANYALRILGRKVPEDVSLVSYESAAVSKFLTPANSTVDQDVDALTEEAAKLAAQIVEGEGPANLVERAFNNKFIERESVKEL